MYRNAFRFTRFSTRRTAVVTAAALALTCGSAAFAHPMGGPGGPMGRGPGSPMGPGPGGPGFFAEHMATMLEEAKARLALDTSQQQLWDAALAQTKTARESGRTLHEKVRNAMRAELAKAEPDLAAVAAIGDDAQAQGQALRRQVREQWLKLYATFNAQQKAVVRELMQARMARAETMRHGKRQHFGGG